MARRRSAEQVEEVETVVEETKPKGRKVEPKPCACSCGEMTGGGRYG